MKAGYARFFPQSSHHARRPFIGRRVLLSLLVCTLPCAPGVAASSTMDESGAAIDLRILQYEGVLGEPLTPETGLCIDHAVGRPLDIATGDSPLAQRAADMISAAAERCSMDASGGPNRFVGELRGSLESGLVEAVASLPAARRCLTQSPSLDTLRPCLTGATGNAPTAEQWPRWTALYDQQRKTR